MDDLDNFLLDEVVDISRAVVKLNEKRVESRTNKSECRLKFLKDSKVNVHQSSTIFVGPCEIYDASKPHDTNLHYYKKNHIALPFLCLEKIKNPIVIVKDKK